MTVVDLTGKYKKGDIIPGDVASEFVIKVLEVRPALASVISTDFVPGFLSSRIQPGTALVLEVGEISYKVLYRATDQRFFIGKVELVNNNDPDPA